MKKWDERTREQAALRLEHLEKKVDRRKRLNKAEEMKSKTRHIRIGFPDDADSIRKVPIHRLNRKALNRMFLVDVDYLADQFGQVVWPHEWVRKCNGPPYTYFLYEKSLGHDFKDAAFDRSYIGESVLLLLNVPAGLTEPDLIAWFRAGMIGSDSRITDLSETINKAEDQLSRTELALSLIKEDEDEEAKRSEVYTKSVDAKAAGKPRSKGGGSDGLGTGGQWATTTQGKVSESGLTGSLTTAATIAVLEDRRHRLMKAAEKLRNTTIPALQLKLRELLTEAVEAEVRFEYVGIHGREPVAEADLEGSTKLNAPSMGRQDLGKAEDELDRKLKNVLEKESFRELHVWQVYLADDDQGSLALQALEFKDWSRVRLIPGDSEKGKEPLAFFDGLAGKLEMDPEMERHFREAFGEKMRNKIGHEIPFHHEMQLHAREEHGWHTDQEQKYQEKVAKEMARDALVRSKCINMKGVAVVRIRHGTGASKDTRPDVSLYTGSWNLGAKTGQGVDVSKAGVFEGTFKRGRRVGQGFFHGYDGTRYEGEFGWKPNKRTKDKLLRSVEDGRIGRWKSEASASGNPYMDGGYHGKGSIVFPDGGTYDGEFVNGRVTGEGVYTTADGVIRKGQFLNGALHGEGVIMHPDGRVQRGTWRHGMQIHAGSEVFADGTVYVGGFHAGMWDGYGALITRNGDALYQGTFRSGFRHGRGTQLYRSLESPTRLAFQCEGAWRSGRHDDGLTVFLENEGLVKAAYARRYSPALMETASIPGKAAKVFLELKRLRAAEEAARSAAAEEADEKRKQYELYTQYRPLMGRKAASAWLYEPEAGPEAASAALRAQGSAGVGDGTDAVESAGAVAGTEGGPKASQSDGRGSPSRKDPQKQVLSSPLRSAIPKKSDLASKGSSAGPAAPGGAGAHPKRDQPSRSPEESLMPPRLPPPPTDFVKVSDKYKAMFMQRAVWRRQLGKVTSRGSSEHVPGFPGLHDPPKFGAESTSEAVQRAKARDDQRRRDRGHSRYTYRAAALAQSMDTMLESTGPADATSTRSEASRPGGPTETSELYNPVFYVAPTVQNMVVAQQTASRQVPEDAVAKLAAEDIERRKAIEEEERITLRRAARRRRKLQENGANRHLKHWRRTRRLWREEVSIQHGEDIPDDFVQDLGTMPLQFDEEEVVREAIVEVPE